jgi:serine/threonine protein kinase
VILFEMLAGRPPFDGPSSVLAIRHATAKAPRVTDFREEVPEALADLIDRSLDKLPSRRHQQGGRFADALAPFLSSPTAASFGERPSARPGLAPRAEEPRTLQPRPPLRPRAPSGPLAAVKEGTIAQGAEAFATQLVDDLVRMHPEEIAAGRRNRDLYRRLHDDIDMFWSLHAKRFPNEQRDWFYDLLVERVVGGNVDLLGPGFPTTTSQLRRRRRRPTLE